VQGLLPANAAGIVAAVGANLLSASFYQTAVSSGPASGQKVGGMPYRPPTGLPF
jgi:hypothetical protein